MKKLSVVLLTLILAAAWTASAFADATPYASVRFATFYSNIDGPGSVDTEDLTFGFATGNTSRFGVKFKTGDINGLFEVNQTVGLRHLFGSYDFGQGVVLIGQTWLPYSIFGSTGVHREDLGAAGDGAMYSWGSFGFRKPQVRVALKMGLYAALIANGSDAANRVDIPELAVGYIGKVANNVTLGVHGSFMQKENVAADDDANCYLLAADVNAKFGAAGLLARVYYGQNLSDIIGGTKAANTEGLTRATAADDFNDFGGFIQGSFKMSDMLAINAGVGYVNNETALDDDDRMVYFVNLPVQIAKGFQVIPELAYYDGMDNAAGTEDADRTWIGAKWQLDF